MDRANLKSSGAASSSFRPDCPLLPSRSQRNLMEILKIVSYSTRFNDSDRIQRKIYHCLLCVLHKFFLVVPGFLKSDALMNRLRNVYPQCLSKSRLIKGEGGTLFSLISCILR